MTTERELCVRTANRLNDWLARDPSGLNSLMRQLTIMSPSLAETELEVMPITQDVVGLNLLGLINGVVTQGQTRLDVKYNTAGSILGFIVVECDPDMYVNKKEEEPDAV